MRLGQTSTPEVSEQGNRVGLMGTFQSRGRVWHGGKTDGLAWLWFSILGVKSHSFWGPAVSLAPGSHACPLAGSNCLSPHP